MARRKRHDPVEMWHKGVAQVAGSKLGSFPIIYLVKDKVWISADPRCTAWARGGMMGISSGEKVHVLPGADDFAVAVSREAFAPLVGMAISNSAVAQVVMVTPGRVRVRRYGLMGSGEWKTFNLNEPRK